MRPRGYVPTHHKSLEGGVEGWGAAQVVVTAAAHDVPGADGVDFFLGFVVGGVVEVGQAEHMPKLVAECTYTCHVGSFVASQFGCDEVRTEVFPAPFGTTAYPALVRPKGIFGATFGFAVAGEENGDIVHFAIVIGIID